MSNQQGTGVGEQSWPEAVVLVSLLLRAQRERAAVPQPDPAAPADTPPSKPAFAEFVERTQRRLLPQVLPLVNGDSHRALDVVQETYLKVWKGLERFDPTKLPSGDPFAWLLRIAHNTAISSGRRRRPLLGSNLPAAGPSGDSRLPEPETPEAGPPGQAMLHELEDALHDAVGRLRPRKRLVLELHYREDLSHREIAERCGLTTGQVNMILYSARQELRARLEKYVVGDRE